MSPASTVLAVTSTTLTGGEVDWIIGGLLFLALLAIASPLLLAWLHQRKAPAGGTDGSTSDYRSFFQIPFVTWFLVHNYIPVLGIVAVSGLALANKITSDTTATLLSGLFGYVLGNAGSHAANSSQIDRQHHPQQDGSE